MKWHMDKILEKNSASGQIFLRKDCAAGKTYQRKCAEGKIFLTES